MSVTIHLSCGGCDAKTEGITPLRQRFKSLSGRSWGFGHYVLDPIDTIIPEGWIAFDPYTGACYCPKCWAEIMEDAPDDTQARYPGDPRGDPNLVDHRE